MEMGLFISFSVQEMAKTAQARKGIQTSPDGELASIFSKRPIRSLKEILSLLLLLLFSDAIASLALIIVTVTVSVSGQDCASLRTLNKWAFAKFRN